MITWPVYDYQYGQLEQQQYLARRHTKAVDGAVIDTGIGTLHCIRTSRPGEPERHKWYAKNPDGTATGAAWPWIMQAEDDLRKWVCGGRANIQELVLLPGTRQLTDFVYVEAKQWLAQLTPHAGAETLLLIARPGFCEMQSNKNATHMRVTGDSTNLRFSLPPVLRFLHTLEAQRLTLEINYYHGSRIRAVRWLESEQRLQEIVFSFQYA